MNIVIKTIDHNEQRYETVGDWFFVGDELHIRVSNMSNWRYEALVALHEMTEVLICKHDGVTQEAVDDFDQNYEEERKRRLHGPDDEAGDASNAPYRKQHGIASGVERVIGAELGVDWNDYADTVNSLSQT